MAKVSAHFIVLALTALSASAEAQDGSVVPYTEYGKSAVQDITISVSDQVANGCLPRAGVLDDVAERRFQAAGISRNEESTNVIWITVLGYAMDEYGCAVSLAMRLDTLAPIYGPDLPETVSPLAYLTLTSRSTIMTGPKDDMQDQIDDAVAEMADAVALEIVRSRDLMAQTE